MMNFGNLGSFVLGYLDTTNIYRVAEVSFLYALWQTPANLIFQVVQWSVRYKVSSFSHWGASDLRTKPDNKIDRYNGN